MLCTNILPVSLQVMRSFLNNSIYSNMLPLFIGQTVIFVSKEPKAKEMLQVLRGSPQMVLLGKSVILCTDLKFIY